MNPLSIQVTFSGKSRLFNLTGPLVTIGSAPECGLVLPFPWISPRHLEIEHGLLLSRIRSASDQSPATLDGYPITTEWSLLPHHGLIEIPSPMGAKLTMAIDLEPIAAAAAIPVPTGTDNAPPPTTGPLSVSLRSDRPPAPGTLLMKYIPLGIAGMLLLGIVAVLFIINSQNPALPPRVVVAPLATPAPTTTPATTESVPEEPPTTEPVVVAPPLVTQPIVEAPATTEPAKPEPPPEHHYTRRVVTTAPSTAPFEYLSLEQETRQLLAHPTTVPYKSDLLRSAAYEQIKQAVRTQLKGAASLDFPDLDASHTILDFHDGTFIARGQFESTNAAGIPIRQMFYCKLRPTGKPQWDIDRVDVFSQ